MQHIGLELENERGELIERSEVNFAFVMVDVFEVENYQDEYPWISTIDPYGNTIFNHYQVPKVIEDLNKLKRDPSASNFETIEQTVCFLEKIDEHKYIQFIGD